MSIIVGVIGSRTFNNYELLKYKLDIIKNYYNGIMKIISGGASGADKYSEKYAIENNIPTKIFYPEWDKYGKKAGFIRNTYIIENSFLVIAFWDNSSKGTLDSIKKCIERRINIVVINFDGSVNREYSNIYYDMM